MASMNRPHPFTLLADGKPRWGCFGASLGLESAALVLIVVLPLLMPQKMELLKHYWYTPIAAPPVSVWKPQPPPPPVKLKPEPVKVVAAVRKEPEPKPEPKPVLVIEPPKPKMLAPVFSSPIAKPATARRQTKTPDTPEVEAALPKDKLSLGSSAIPTIRKPRAEVQTGGFGDPNGLPANGRTDKTANIAKLGSYDMPTGPGYGNGTGGANGARGVVGSTGFGNGVAKGGSGSGGRGGVKQGVFADERPVAEGPKVRKASVESAEQPVEILFKPKPAYTDAARQKKIEGVVLLQVVFSATGQVQVLRVVKGLGYGLDGTAQAAAQQIKFRPAKRDGQPVDFTANVEIIYELAY